MPSMNFANFRNNKNPRLMIVDDNPFNIEILKDLLTIFFKINIKKDVVIA
jgi:hypothetical protein